MKLYTFPASPGCRPIAMFIADHGMTVEEQVVDLMNGEQYGPAFTAINPNNAVPVLEDGDMRLPECSAILKYLADVVDSPAYSKDLKARAQVNAAMDWVNTGLYPAFGHNLCYPQVLAFAKWEDDKAQSLVLGRGQTRSRKLLSVVRVRSPRGAAISEYVVAMRSASIASAAPIEHSASFVTHSSARALSPTSMAMSHTRYVSRPSVRTSATASRSVTSGQTD